MGVVDASVLQSAAPEDVDREIVDVERGGQNARLTASGPQSSQ